MEEQNKQNEQIKKHYGELLRQAEEFAKDRPGFDLQEELKNPRFLRMTAPGMGISVREAYRAVHHEDLVEEAVEQVRKKIRAGQERTRELGADGSNGTLIKADYSRMSKEERMQFKKRIRDAAQRGEKIFPD